MTKKSNVEKLDIDRLSIEEFRIWRKNTPYLYDVVSIKRNFLPLFTCQWLPETVKLPDTEFYVQHILLGTSCWKNSSFDSLLKAQVTLPEKDCTFYDDLETELQYDEKAQQKGLKIVQTQFVGSDVNRLKYMPQNPRFVAVRASCITQVFKGVFYLKDGSVSIFDINIGAASETQYSQARYILNGPPKEDNCFALSWSPAEKGFIAAGGRDNKVYLWRFDESSKDSREFSPNRTFVDVKQKQINDVHFHPKGSLIASAGEERQVVFWDMRSPHSVLRFTAHEKGINCLEFHPQKEDLLLTGSMDGTIGLWDTRKSNEALHVFRDHNDAVIEVHWSPFSSSVFASSSSKRIFIWDINHIFETDDNNIDNCSSELLFIHGGHMKNVEGFDWNPINNWMIASGGSDHLLEIWSPAPHVYNMPDFDCRRVDKEAMPETSVETDESVLEEYAIWRKNTPFLYDLVVTKPLEWPSLTCQWLSEKRELPNSDYYLEKLLLGTQTDGNAQNYLIFAQVRLPNERAEVDGSAYNNKENGTYGGFGAGQHGRIDIVQRIKHEGDVNRARYMPQNPHVIATKTVSGEVHIFDSSKHPLKPPVHNICSPQLRLRGPQKEGFALSWNPTHEGRIISAGEDRRIFLWDILEGGKENDESVNPLSVYTGHNDVVGDVSFHPQNRYLFASVGDDKKIMVWDTRSSDYEHASQQVDAHKDVINCLAFNPFSENVLITGSADTTLCLWDMRSLDQSLHVFESHSNEILQALWSPFHETIFASCGKDRQVRIWDLSRIGEEQDPEDAEDGPPELLFVHGGHTAVVQDFSWNPNEPFVISSVADDNILQIWSMAQHIYEDTDDEKMETELKEEDLE
eukprot:jgi/Galph1/4014/GphlegSOOS_G2705.1